jgi:hypothetical protein
MKSQVLWSVWKNIFLENKIRLDLAAQTIDFLPLNRYIKAVRLALVPGKMGRLKRKMPI